MVTGAFLDAPPPRNAAGCDFTSEFHRGRISRRSHRDEEFSG